ncbi:MAG: S1 family peptidase, partial [Propionibacteriaceae bacterium]
MVLPRHTALVLAALTVASTSIATVPASAAPTPHAVTHVAALPLTSPTTPDGLAAALQRDTSMTVEQFTQQAAVTTQAAQINTVLAQQGISGRTVVVDGALQLQSRDPQAQAVAQAHGIALVARQLDPRVGSAENLLTLYLEQVGNAGLLGVGLDADGYVILVNGADTSKATSKTGLSPRAFAQQFTGITVKESGGPAQPSSDQEFYSGQGFQSSNTVCSAGFLLQNEVGTKYMSTAGHCWDGNVGALVPTSIAKEPVVGGPGKQTVAGGPVGSYDWGSFGGNKPNTFGSDVATILLNGNYTYPNQATTWQNGGQLPITGYIADPQTALGHTACRSGRATGWQCGLVNYIGYVAVKESSTDTRYVWSVGAALKAANGDSGGAMLIGHKALGMTSATGTSGGAPFTAAAPVADLLTQFRTNLQLAINLNQPR